MYKILGKVVGSMESLSCNDEYWLHDSKENLQNSISVIVFPKGDGTKPFEYYMNELYSKMISSPRWNIQMSTLLGKHYFFKQKSETFEEYYKKRSRVNNA